MTSGCAPGSVAATDWTGPVVVDTAPLRCPPADPRARAEFRRVVAAPTAREIAAARAAGHLDGLTRAKIDELRAALVRKNAAGRRALDEQDKCSGASPQPAAVAVNKPVA